MSRTIGGLFAKLYPLRPDAPSIEELEALQKLLEDHDFIHAVRHQRELEQKDVERADTVRGWMNQVGAMRQAAKRAGFRFRALDDGAHVAEPIPPDDEDAG